MGREQRLRVGPVREQRDGDGAAPHLPRVLRAALGDRRTRVAAAVHHGAKLGQREEGDVLGAFEQPLRPQFGAEEQEAPAAVEQGVQAGELPGLAQPGQLAGAAQEEAREQPAHGPHAPRPPRELREHRLRPGRGALEPPVRGLLGIGDQQVAPEHREDRRRVLGPARHPDVDLGGAAVAVGLKEVGQAEVGQLAGEVGRGELVRRCPQQELAVRLRPPGHLPQGQVHLDRDVVRHAAEHGPDLVLVRDAFEERRQRRGHQQPGDDRPRDVPDLVVPPFGRLDRGQQLPSRRRVLDRSPSAAFDRVEHAGPRGRRSRQRAEDPGRGPRPHRQRGRAAPAAARHGGEARVVQEVLDHGLRPRSEVDRQELHQPPPRRRVAHRVGQVAVQPPADVHDLDPQAERGEHPGQQLLERRHARRRHRLEHPLDVAELDVQARPGPLRRGRRGEQRGDRPRLQQPQRSTAVIGPLDVLRRAELPLEPLPGLAELLQFGRSEAAPLLGAGAVQDIVVGRGRPVDHSGARPGGGVDHAGAP